MDMIEQHLAMVRRLKKPREVILAELDLEDVDAIHMALGLAGEAGEVVDLVKKITMNRKPITDELRNKLIEELGDVMFYITGLVEVIGVDLDFVLHKNIEKLTTRYPEGYSDQASAARVDRDG